MDSTTSLSLQNIPVSVFPPLMEVRESPIQSDLVILVAEKVGADTQKISVATVDLNEMQNRHVFGTCNQKKSAPRIFEVAKTPLSFKPKTLCFNGP